MNQNPTELAKRVLSLLLHNDRQDGLYDHLHIDNWEWPTGIALYGIYKFYRKTGEKEFLETLVQWYERHLAGEPVHRNVNTVTPMLTLVFLYEELHREEWRAPIESWVEWIMQEMPRTEYGGLQHMTVLNQHYQQLWDDTLFMTVLFLAKAGKVLGRPELVEEAKYQFLLHIKYLQDNVTGLWYHGWTFDRRHNFARAFWARGNSWYTAGALEFLEILDEEDAVTRMVVASWQDQVKELRKYQGQNGLFNTLLNVEESYFETSATANIAYGLLKGMRMKLIGPEYASCARKAAEAVIGQIRADGTVDGVSYGTGMGSDLEHYKKIPICPTGYGQGTAFLMLTELI